MHLSARQSPSDASAARSRRFLILPDSRFRTGWDILLVFLVVYNAFALPYTVCFSVDQPHALYILDQLIDGVFYLDLILNFLTAYEVQGHLVCHHPTIAKHYLTHWFTVDIIATFPFEIFNGASVGDAHTLEITLLRGLKCIRLIRLARLFKFLEKIEFVSHFLKLLRLLFGFFIIAHWLACLWYLIGSLGLDWSRAEGPQGWMVAYNNSGWDVNQKTNLSAYVTSLYWTVTTLLTVGYGDISARTNTEKMFAILTMVFGALISATIFGNVTMLIESMGRSEAAYREKMEAVKYSMVDLDLPAPLQHRIRDFYSLLWARNRSFGSEQVLAELPASFHHEIAGFLHQDLFDKMLIFMDSDPVFLRHLASRLKFCVSLPNDDIIREGESPAEKVYFIRKGACSVAKEGYGKLTVLKEGSYFGEVGVLAHEFIEELLSGSDAKQQQQPNMNRPDQPQSPSTAAASPSSSHASPPIATTVGQVSSNKRTASVTALVNCDLYFLTDVDFLALLQLYPQYHRLFLLIALVRFKQVDYHDDEDILQKVFFLQVRKKELRLKYHRKERIRQVDSGAGAGASGGVSVGTRPRRRKGDATDAPIVETGVLVEDVFAESTRELIRRVSSIGIPPTQQTTNEIQIRHKQIEQTDERKMGDQQQKDPPPTIALPSTTPICHGDSNSFSLLPNVPPPSPVASSAAAPLPSRASRSVRPIATFESLPEVREEEEDGPNNNTSIHIDTKVDNAQEKTTGQTEKEKEKEKEQDTRVHAIDTQHASTSSLPSANEIRVTRAAVALAPVRSTRQMPIPMPMSMPMCGRSSVVSSPPSSCVQPHAPPLPSIPLDSSSSSPVLAPYPPEPELESTSADSSNRTLSESGAPHTHTATARSHATRNDDSASYPDSVSCGDSPPSVAPYTPVLQSLGCLSPSLPSSHQLLSHSSNSAVTLPPAVPLPLSRSRSLSLSPPRLPLPLPVHAWSALMHRSISVRPLDLDAHHHAHRNRPHAHTAIDDDEKAYADVQSQSQGAAQRATANSNSNTDPTRLHTVTPSGTHLDAQPYRNSGHMHAATPNHRFRITLRKPIIKQTETDHQASSRPGSTK